MQLLDLIGEKETLDTFLERSKEFMQKMITGMETSITKAIEKDQREND